MRRRRWREEGFRRSPSFVSHGRADERWEMENDQKLFKSWDRLNSQILNLFVLQILFYRQRIVRAKKTHIYRVKIYFQLFMLKGREMESRQESGSAESLFLTPTRNLFFFFEITKSILMVMHLLYVQYIVGHLLYCGALQTPVSCVGGSGPTKYGDSVPQTAGLGVSFSWLCTENLQGCVIYLAQLLLFYASLH